MARTYHKSRMESISLFSTSTALEGLELFNPLPDPLDGESDFLHEYNDDVYSCIEERKAPLSNLLAEDLLQELNFEGLYYYFLVLRQCIFNRGVLILRSQLLSRVIFLRFARNVNDCEKFSFRRQCDSLYFFDNSTEHFRSSAETVFQSSQFHFPLFVFKSNAPNIICCHGNTFS